MLVFAKTYEDKIKNFFEGEAKTVDSNSLVSSMNSLTGIFRQKDLSSLFKVYNLLACFGSSPEK